MGRVHARAEQHLLVLSVGEIAISVHAEAEGVLSEVGFQVVSLNVAQIGLENASSVEIKEESFVKVNLLEFDVSDWVSPHFLMVLGGVGFLVRRFEEFPLCVQRCGHVIAERSRRSEGDAGGKEEQDAHC